MLRNAAGFPGSNVGLANDVQQSCFPMVHMAHDSNHRSARDHLLRFVLDIQLQLSRWSMNYPASALALFQFETIAVFVAYTLGNGFIDRLIHAGKNAKLH